MGTMDLSKKSKTLTAAANKRPSYNPPSPSVLSKLILFPLYDQIVKIYPVCLHPNCITIFGIISTLIASFIILSAMPIVMPEAIESHIGDVSVSSRASTSPRHLDLSVEAGKAFLSHLNIRNISDTNVATVALWLASVNGGGSIDTVNGGLRSAMATDYGTMTACSRTGLYGKEVHLLPKSLRILFEEIVNMMKKSDASPVKKENVEETLATKRAMDFSDKYEFHYPIEFSNTLLVSGPRYRVATSILLSNITGLFFNFVKTYTNPDDYKKFQLLWNAYTIDISIPSVFSRAADFCSTAFFNLFTNEIREIPGRSMMIVAGILNLIYCIADNTDGRHARRTNKSSYVGEYLDHGLDCATSLLSTFVLMMSLGGEAYYSGFGILCVGSVTLMCHIINQEKSIMIWGNSIITVDEAMVMFGGGLIFMAFYPNVTTAKLPIDMLQTYFGIPLSYLPMALYHIRISDVLLATFILLQCHLALTIAKNDISILFCRFTSLAMLTNAVVITYFTNVFGQPVSSNLLSGTLRKITSNAIVVPEQLNNLFPFIADSMKCLTSPQTNAIVKLLPYQFISLLQSLDASVEMLFSFEAQWVIVAVCTCSIIVHVPIVSKCLRIPSGGSVLSIVLSLPAIWITFFFISSALGAVLAIFCHLVQILVNIHALQVAGAQWARE